jgi:chromosome partitioning protein
LPLLESYIGRIKREFGKDIYFLGIILTMVRPDWKIYRIVKEKLEQQPQWRNKLFNIELKYRTIVARALSPEERESKSQYILDLGDRELEEQIVQITEELLRRGRI